MLLVVALFGIFLIKFGEKSISRRKTLQQKFRLKRSTVLTAIAFNGLRNFQNLLIQQKIAITLTVELFKEFE